jgi:hypothetical protein
MEWKKIEDYPNYEINEYGKVKSLNAYGNTGKVKILNGGKSRGYQIYTLNHLGKHKKFYAHKLVAKLWLGIDLKGHKNGVIDHIDGNINNNHYSNLRVLSNYVNGLKDVPSHTKAKLEPKTKRVI